MGMGNLGSLINFEEVRFELGHGILVKKTSFGYQEESEFQSRETDDPDIHFAKWWSDWSDWTGTVWTSESEDLEETGDSTVTASSLPIFKFRLKYPPVS